jgi:hypothetical protein
MNASLIRSPVYLSQTVMSKKDTEALILKDVVLSG